MNVCIFLCIYLPSYPGDETTIYLSMSHLSYKSPIYLSIYPNYLSMYCTDIYVQGVHKILCFFLKIRWFFLTMPVLLQRGCSICLVIVHTLTPRENRERPRVRNIFKSMEETQYLMNTLYLIYLGDDTWLSLYPDSFRRADPQPSFDVWDLDSVDNKVSMK